MHLHNERDVIFDEDGDYCVCKVCEMQWNRTDKGWNPIWPVNGTPRVADTASKAKRQYWANRNRQQKGSLNRGRKPT